MYERHEIGKTGEEIAAEYLKEKGYEILAKNYACLLGELDIVAKLGNEIVFIEVKTRTQDMFGSPAEAVNFTKMRHIYKVAEYFIMKNNLEKNFIRFDVIEVYKCAEDYDVKHIKNAITERPW